MNAGPLRLARYRIEALLGRGGVTETYRAHLADTPVGQEGAAFALKLLRPDRGGSEPAVSAAFLAAARRLEGLSLPGVAPVIEVAGVEEIFAVSALLQGADLARHREAEALDAAAVGRLGARIAAALERLHRHRPEALVHGGLSPGNVLVSPSGEPVLLDAGITAAVRPLTDNPLDRWLFASPEQLAGEPPTPASDLYGLGAVLYFLLAGRPPFVADSREALRALVWTGPPAVPGAPAWLAETVEALLAASPADRPPSAAHVARTLEGALAPARAVPVRAPAAADRAAPGPAPLSLPAAPPRRRSATPALALGLVGVAVASGVWLSRRGGREAAPSAAGAAPVPLADAAALVAGPGPAATAAADVAVAPLGPGQLRVVSDPPGAALWIDGEERGRTPRTLETTPGVRKIVLVLAGFRMHREAVDTSAGALIERTLSPATWRPDGPVLLRVLCHTSGKYPVFVGGRDTGLLCPAEELKIGPGTHMIGLFVIPQDRIWSFEREIEPGAASHRVIFAY